MRVTEDEYGIVSVYEDGQLRMFMHRLEWETLRKDLSLPPVEPEPVVSGGAAVYGIERRDA